ncbi:hypothetical protein EL26_21195 [Tumebacillus flagellatus]|uniref:Uncharacterized protein n=2 Tax=Tumebacillus flagellatus TaxID=1157490 RepID=A0A074LGJ1_9BACL|nr:hypothetical protein EL26_21195 [Tumebacillus flagellatus]
MRPTTTRATAYGSEVGTIGEREQEREQQTPAPIRMRQQDGTLNNDNVEIGSIGDFKQGLMSQYGLAPKQQGFASSQVQQQARRDAQQAFSSEVGTIGQAGQQQQSQQSGSQASAGQQGQQAQGGAFASSQVQQQMRSDAQQAFSAEVGSLDGSQASAGQNSQNPTRTAHQSQNQIGAVHPTGSADMQKFTVEAGDIGSVEQLSLIDGQGNTLLPNIIPGTNGMGYFPPQAADAEVGMIGESQGQSQKKNRNKTR